MNEGLSASRFYMWRAVVAMAHADGIVTPHEVNFLHQQMKDVPMSDGQLQMLAKDLTEPQNIRVLFLQITDKQDKRDFFKLARVLSWADGDFDAQEKHILEYLESLAGEDEGMLKSSRDDVKEIVLSADQWEEKIKTKGLLEFLGRMAA